MWRKEGESEWLRMTDSLPSPGWHIKAVDAVRRPPPETSRWATYRDAAPGPDPYSSTRSSPQAEALHVASVIRAPYDVQFKHYAVSSQTRRFLEARDLILRYNADRSAKSIHKSIFSIIKMRTEPKPSRAPTTPPSPVMTPIRHRRVQL